MKVSNYILLPLALIALSSCNRFLGNIPKGYQIPETVEEYEAILNDQALLTYGTTVLDLMTDEAYIPAELPAEYVQVSLSNMPPSWRRIYTYTDSFYGENEEDNLYEDTYHRIFVYNAIIEGLKDRSGGEKQEARRVIAEAKASRAFEYLLLAMVYAPPYEQERAKTAPATPLLLTDDITIRRPPIATQQELLGQVFEDLESAMKDLPNKPVTNAYRMSKAAAHAILARAAFFTRDYALALSEAKTALSLHGDLLDMTPLELNDDEYGVGVRNNYPAPLDNPENILIRHLSPYVGLSEYLLIGHHLTALYGVEPQKDMRYALFVTDKPGGLTSANPEGELTWDPAVQFNIGLSTPELYLIVAEVEARNGHSAKALTALNTLREKRITGYFPLTTTDSKALVKEAIDEREREYLFRGYYRYMELKRLAEDKEYAVTVTHHDASGHPIVVTPGSEAYLHHPLPSKVLSYREM